MVPVPIGENYDCIATGRKKRFDKTAEAINLHTRLLDGANANALAVANGSRPTVLG